MINSLFGAGTDVAMLRGGLDETSATERVIAARVAQAQSSSLNGDFASQLAAKSAAGAKNENSADLQRDMAALADTDLRYESCAKLLQGSYATLRGAITTNT